MKRIVCILLSLTVVLSTIFCMGINTLAADSKENLTADPNYPLNIEFTTDRNSYSSLSTAKFTVKITNVSEKKVDGISTQSEFKDVQVVGSGNTLFVDGKSLESGESMEYTYSATVKPSKLSFFGMIILLIKNIINGTQTAPNNNFEDGRVKISAVVETKFGSVTVSDTVNVWYKQQTEIIKTKTDTDYDKEVTELINSQIESETFNKQEALSEEFYTQRIIVDGKSLDKIDLGKYSPETIIYNKDNSQAVVQCNSQAIAEKCEKELNALGNVDLAEVDTILTTYAESGSDLTWGKEYIKADSYEHYLENNNYFDMITVAVVDSGIDFEHSYLKNRITSNGADLVRRDNKADDENGHGTHVAGIIANCTDGLNVKILPIKVMDGEGVGSSYIVAQGVEQAANNGADVINLSLGGKKNKILDEAVEYAIKEKGAVVCVAAGNGDEENKPVDTADVSPACVKDAIVVSAIDNKGKIAYFSNYGESVDVAAPGVDVYSTYKNGTYAKLSGTSMAAPHISAAAAMFRLTNPSYTPAQIENLIKDYCKDLGAEGKDNVYGYGTVNMYDAIPDCTVKFNTNGGTASGNQTVKSSEEITLPKPTKSYTIKLNANGGSVKTSTYTVNCELEGWYKSSSLTGVRYAPNATYLTHDNETLYAKWNNPKNVALNEATRANYTFIGWWTDPSGGKQFSTLEEITGNITLYAHWEIKPVVVPNYTNWDIDSAKSSLNSIGLNYTTSYSYNCNYASGKVYGQSVGANSSVPIGTTVTLYVSSGSKPISSGDWVVFNGGTTLYRTVAGGPKNGVYKADPCDGDITGVYVYNGTTYYQFRYAGNSQPFGWAPSWAFSQKTN